MGDLEGGGSHGATVQMPRTISHPGCARLTRNPIGDGDGDDNGNGNGDGDGNGDDNGNGSGRKCAGFRENIAP
jgi:hypothetical protein